MIVGERTLLSMRRNALKRIPDAQLRSCRHLFRQHVRLLVRRQIRAEAEFVDDVAEIVMIVVLKVWYLYYYWLSLGHDYLKVLTSSWICIILFWKDFPGLKCRFPMTLPRS